VLVPREPTPEMVEMGCNCRISPNGTTAGGVIATWNAMLAAAPPPAAAEAEYEYEVWQGDALQAGGITTDYASAQSEAGHYAMMYAPDGPVEVRIYEKRLLADAPPPPSAPVGVEGPLSLLRAGHWREVYIGHRCMRLEVTYDYATWERLMAEVESALAQQPAAARVDVRGLVTLAEQWERDAGGCRRDGYMDAAVVKEDCAFRLRQALGISAIAEALAAEGVQTGDAEAKTVPVPTRVHLIGETAVIVGTPGRGWDEDGPDAHNCDAMGCETIGPHVLARVPFTDERALSQPEESAPVGGEGLLADLETIWHSVSDDKETNAAYQRLKSALAQQPDAVSAGGCVANGAHVWCNGHVVATAHGLTLAPYRAARIAACLNACAGIADPGALVQAARDAVDWIVDYVPDNVGGRDFTLANLRRAMGGAAQSADAEAQASEARGVVNLRKVRNNVLAVIPGGNICDPQQVADDVRAVFAIFEAEARNGR
jgi:hypothetical protein